MGLVDVLPWIVAAALAGFMLLVVMHDGGLPRSAWIAPAIASALFLVWSALAAISEGPLGFWTEHTRNMWGNQIWFDLLLAVGVGWLLIAPRARAAGMPLLPWMLLVLATGSIGFLAMTSRLLYLEERKR